MKVAITNMHLDLGAGRRGTDMGPSAMHVAGLIPRIRGLGHEVVDLVSIEARAFEEGDPGDLKMRFLGEITNVCRQLANRVATQAAQGLFPLVLGGDHAQALGTIAGLTQHYGETGGRLGVLWVDAHTDMNTPDTTPSGNVHGMPLAALLGVGPPELVGAVGGKHALRGEDVVVFGVRDVDRAETPLVKELGVRVYTMSEIDMRGLAVCLTEAIERTTAHTAGVHLSFDLDSVDPRDAPGVGTPVPGGLSVREAHTLCEVLAHSSKLVGMEMVELNPTLDVRNQTGELGVWLILSALGKRIL